MSAANIDSSSVSRCQKDGSWPRDAQQGSKSNSDMLIHSMLFVLKWTGFEEKNKRLIILLRTVHLFKVCSATAELEDVRQTSLLFRFSNHFRLFLCNLDFPFIINIISFIFLLVRLSKIEFHFALCQNEPICIMYICGPH